MPVISVTGIGAPTPSGSKINDVWVEYGGYRTTEVPAGQPFKIRANGEANIPGQIVLTCEMLFTAISGDGAIAQFDRTRPQAGGPIYKTGDMHLKYSAFTGAYLDPIMPNKDITLRFKLWGNDFSDKPLPPLTDW